MKGIIIGLILFLFVGCAGLNVSVPVDMASDVTFVLVLKNNPAMKPVIANSLKELKVFLAGSVTYDAFIAEIGKKFGADYAYVGVILQGYISTDKPIFETWVPMLDSYKQGIIAKLDRYLLLTSL